MSQSAQIVSLNYVPKPARTLPTNSLLRRAAMFALVPLVAGVLTLVLYVIFDSFFFAVVSLFIILGGLLCTLIGGACLIWHYVLTVAARDGASGRRWIPVRYQWLTLLLLVSNFPIAYACIATASYADKFYVVTITNKSSEPMQEVLVTSGTGDTAYVKNLASGASVTRRVQMGHDGASYRLVRNGVTHEGAFVYAPYDWPNDMDMTIERDGTVTARSAQGSRAHLLDGRP